MIDKLRRGDQMFTSSVFKDLLLPLFDEIKENSIHLPLKSTNECDFSDELSILISNCGMDPRIFVSSISSLNKSRKEVASSVSSISEHFHYFIELESISMRLSPKSVSRLFFSWTDAFEPNKSETQSSLAFEKSNVLYNLASKINNEALKDLNTQNIKSPVKDLCISATIFDWIAKNFANAPLNDIRSEFSKFISCLCLLQAQEMAFLSSVQEEKGLKTLVRLSLGLMNLIQSAKSLATNLELSKTSLIDQRLENKATLHTFMHCLLMADFWDSHDLYDVAFDLYSTSSRIFEGLKLSDKIPISDYLKVSLMRSEKERQNISYEGKKVSESEIKIEPYYIANIMDFKSILKPYLSTYTSLFSNVYPFQVIELQSEFEAKADTIIKTLERASEEVALVFVGLSEKINTSTEGFIFDLRNAQFNNDLEGARSHMNEIQFISNDLQSHKRVLIPENSYDSENSKIRDLLNSLENSLIRIEKSKIGLILNDNALIQTMMPLIRDMHLNVSDSLRSNLTTYEMQSKKQFELYESLKHEIRVTDLRESLLGAENPSLVIDRKINSFDNTAIEVLRITEAQRNIVTKTQNSWDQLISLGLNKMNEVVPGVAEILPELKNIINELKASHEIIINTVKEQKHIEYSSALYFKSKLIELLNKY